MSNYLKDPDAVLDYTWDWTAWLADSETIADATVTTNTDTITIDSQTATDTAVTAWLSGGTTGTVYVLTCHITTNQGRQDDRTIRITIRER